MVFNDFSWLLKLFSIDFKGVRRPSQGSVSAGVGFVGAQKAFGARPPRSAPGTWPTAFCTPR